MSHISSFSENVNLGKSPVMLKCLKNLAIVHSYNFICEEVWADPRPNCICLISNIVGLIQGMSIFEIPSVNKALETKQKRQGLLISSVTVPYFVYLLMSEMC